MSRRDAAVCAEATGASPRGAAAGADLGGSSKYSSEILEGRVWRRVPCEQPLHMGQSILSPRVVPLRAEASAWYSRVSGLAPWAKGNRVNIPEPEGGARRPRGGRTL